MTDIARVSSTPFDINASFDRSVALQNSYLAEQQELQHPGFWRSVYEAVPFTSAKEERMEKIEALKTARQICMQIQEAMAKAINQQWGGSSNIPSFPMMG